MLAKKKDSKQSGMFFGLEDTLNQRHPIYILANKVNWSSFDEAFEQLYCSDNGRPAKPIRLMVGLLILKHLRNISDESVVEQWSENVYYQYFCGQKDFLPSGPCEAPELVHFRHRIGEAGIELILKESIRVNGDDSHDPTASIDTTVQEKNITFPTDSKLHRKIIDKCKKIAAKERLPVRQSYTRTLKKLAVDQRFRNHPRNKGKARKADRKMRTIAGRLVRELERNLYPDSKHQPDIDLFKRILIQKKGDGGKVYSTHEPDVQCISKGKEHKKYEFGNKVSIIHTQTTGVIVGALGFRNPYDGHTVESALEQAERLIGKATIKTLIGDRGYKGVKKVNGTSIEIPKPFNDKKQGRYRQNRLRKQFKRRAAIEPVNAHLKTDHRLGRNFYKGITGDNINVMLAAAAFNFKRMINKRKSSFWPVFKIQIVNLIKLKFYQINNNINLKWAF
ncbi:MAG: IS5 family transposase [Bacteroidales bacterium 45-6]|nr:MAG: IS5 family transposase [Bacteroidales bacterium 45-6]